MKFLRLRLCVFSAPDLVHLFSPNQAVTPQGVAAARRKEELSGRQLCPWLSFLKPLGDNDAERWEEKGGWEIPEGSETKEGSSTSSQETAPDLSGEWLLVLQAVAPCLFAQRPQEGRLGFFQPPQRVPTPVWDRGSVSDP